MVNITGERIKFISEYSYYVPKPTVVGEADNDTMEDIDMSGETPPDNSSQAEIEQTGESAQSTVDGKIEVNMTDIINKQQEAISQLTQQLNQWVADINNNIDGVKRSVASTKDETTRSIQGMKNEVDDELKKRIPTPHEKLLMQSLSAYPYNVKLTDYFIPAKPDISQTVGINKDGIGRNYFDKIYNQSEQTSKEYILTGKDVENSYNSIDIESSM